MHPIAQLIESFDSMISRAYVKIYKNSLFSNKEKAALIIEELKEFVTSLSDQQLIVEALHKEKQNILDDLRKNDENIKRINFKFYFNLVLIKYIIQMFHTHMLILGAHKLYQKNKALDEYNRLRMLKGVEEQEYEEIEDSLVFLIKEVKNLLEKLESNYLFYDLLTRSQKDSIRKLFFSEDELTKIENDTTEDVKEIQKDMIERDTLLISSGIVDEVQYRRAMKETEEVMSRAPELAYDLQTIPMSNAVKEKIFRDKIEIPLMAINTKKKGFLRCRSADETRMHENIKDIDFKKSMNRLKNLCGIKVRREPEVDLVRNLSELTEKLSKKIDENDLKHQEIEPQDNNIPKNGIYHGYKAETDLKKDVEGSTDKPRNEGEENDDVPKKPSPL